jgi:hypothetical protein
MRITYMHNAYGVAVCRYCSQLSIKRFECFYILNVRLLNANLLMISKTNRYDTKKYENQLVHFNYNVRYIFSAREMLFFSPLALGLFCISRGHLPCLPQNNLLSL